MQNISGFFVSSPIGKEGGNARRPSRPTVWQIVAASVARNSRKASFKNRQEFKKNGPVWVQIA